MKGANGFGTGVARLKGKVTDSKKCGESVSPGHLNWIYPSQKSGWISLVTGDTSDSKYYPGTDNSFTGFGGQKNHNTML